MPEHKTLRPYPAVQPFAYTRIYLTDLY